MRFVRLIQNRLERVDIYSRESADSGYVGKAVKPKLLGYVYADVQPISRELLSERAGKSVKEAVKLILRPDAGVKCGDLAAVYGKEPVWEITEVKRFSNHIAATAVIK